MAGLAHMALQNVLQAFRPATQKSYNGMFRLFLTFTVFMRVSLANLTPLVLLSYMQCLHASQVSTSAMANYMSAIKAKLALFGLPIQCFNPRIKYFHKAMGLRRPLKVQLKQNRYRYLAAHCQGL